LKGRTEISKAYQAEDTYTFSVKEQTSYICSKDILVKIRADG